MWNFGGLAIATQVIRDVTAAYKRFADGRTTFVSIAAGTPVATFEHILGHLAPIIRCMPNTPALVGAGAAAFSRGKLVGD